MPAMSVVSTCRRPAVWVCWQDQRRLLSDVCKETGADFDFVYGRLLSGWFLERALFAPAGAPRDADPPPALWAEDDAATSCPNKATRPAWVDWQGQRRRLVDVCFDHHIRPATVRDRMRHGWPIEDAVRTPNARRRTDSP